MMSPRTLKILGFTYLVKALLVALAWVLVPDLPHRAKTLLDDAFRPRPAMRR